MPSAIPSFVPRSMVSVDSKLPGSRSITRAAIGLTEVSSTSASTNRRRFAPRGLAILRGTVRLLLGRVQDALEHVEVLEALPGTLYDRVERVGGDDERHAGFVAQPLTQAEKQRASAGHDDAARHDVGRE